MLFQSSLRKELARSFGATSIVLVTVVMTMTLIRTLGMASRGSFAPSDVIFVMGYTVLAYMPTLLTLGLFIAIISTFTRMYRESEMVIWLASGQGLLAMLKPLLRFAWPVLLVVAGLSLAILPWTNQRIHELKSQYEQRGDLERVEPGQFQESADGSRVFFVEKDSSNGKSGTNIFIATTDKDKETITSARSGRVEQLDNGRFLMLDNGQRLEVEAGSSDIKISEFQQYGTQVSADVMGQDSFVPVNTRTTAYLLENLTPSHWAELSWRVGMILASFNFVVIGITVSSTNPRVARSGNMVFALFAFVFYYNLLSLGQSWIASGKFSFGQFVLGLHGGVLLLALLMLVKSHHNLRWPELLRVGFSRTRGAQA